MNKQELINKVAKQTKLPKSRILNMIDSMVGSIETELKKGKKVQLVGFGSWQKVRRKARPGRNPQTGQKLTIPSRNVAKFNMGQHLFDQLN